MEELRKKQHYLEQKKIALQTELDSIEEELFLCTDKLYKKCIEDGGHYFRRDYDYQLYGEVILTCTNCGYIK